MMSSKWVLWILSGCEKWARICHLMVCLRSLIWNWYLVSDFCWWMSWVYQCTSNRQNLHSFHPSHSLSYLTTWDVLQCQMIFVEGSRCRCSEVLDLSRCFVEWRRRCLQTHWFYVILWIPDFSLISLTEPHSHVTQFYGSLSQGL